MKSDTISLGPYRATKLWNDAILTFRSGMSVGRHRRYMKSYDSCFIASESIDWLHEELKNNPNFGPKVTRNQTIQLLQKFQKARVFEDCRGSKYNKDEFTDNGRLYRFVETDESPVKVIQSKTPRRAPLATQSAMMNSLHRTLRPPLLEKSKPEIESTGECRTVSRSLKPQEIEDVWKSVTLNWLQKALQLTNLDEILDSDYVNPQNIIHNVTHVNRNGVVTNIDREDQLPKWVLSAMRCLAHWPMKVEGDLPDYPGFEKDVYNTVTGYFQGLKEPLLTYSMYEVFTNVFVCAENMGRPRQSSRNNSAQNTPKAASIGLTSYASVENLMANLTMHAESILIPPPQQSGPKVNGNGYPTDDAKAKSLKSSRSGYVADPTGYDKEVHNADITLPPEELQKLRPGVQPAGLARIQMPPPSAPPPPPPPRSSSLFSAALIETSFGIDNNEPRTRVYANLPHARSQDPAQKLDPFFDPYGQSIAATRKRQASGSDLKDSKSNVYASTMSMYQTWREDDAVFDAESKCYSMSDVHNIQPCPENELARKSTKNPSWGSVHSATNAKDSDTDSCQYGYTVVLSRTPKGEGKRHSTTGDYISTEHCYSLSRHKGMDRLDRDCVSTSDLHRGPPPPYRPPPKYERNPPVHLSPSENADDYPKLSQTSRYARTSTSSVSSYESARSHLSPNNVSPPTVNGYDTPSPSSHNTSVGGSSQPGSAGHRSLASARESAAVRSKVNLAESYQLAIDGSCTTPTGNRLFGNSLRRAYSSPNLLSPVARNRVQEALQICCLLLPPANRRKLHLLLRLMNKMANNEELVIDEEQTTRDLVLQNFSRCILRSADETDYEEDLVLRLVTFLMDNYNDVMKVPESLKLQIDDRITHLRRNKMKYGWDNPTSSSSSLSYCEQVSVEEYERQKMSSSQRALQDLLENIIHDRKLNPRDKKKRLKQFQKNHPDVYCKRFPTSESEAELFPNKPRIKPPLLSKPLQKLKSFRI